VVGAAVSWVDMAITYPGNASNFGGGGPTTESNANTFWTTTAFTTTGGRFYWVASSNQPDSVTVNLRDHSGTILTSATITGITTSGVQSFSWGASQNLSIYAFYYLHVTSTHGTTNLNANTLPVAGAGVFPTAPYVGTSMIGPSGKYVWAWVGIQYAGSGTPVGQGSGNNTTTCPVEAT
jgi:hypothetical protein